jgi:tellurite resistance protein TerC
LEGLLSLDNAAVLGAMVAILPEHQPVPYPQPLRFLQNFTNRFLGMQQAAALKAGLLMAYLGRGLMLAVAAWISLHPLLKILGAVYLLKLALEHLAQHNQPELNIQVSPAADQEQKKMAAFWLVVLNVELADLAFSLDNVVVAVALSPQFWVVLFGVAIGIVMMRFAAGLFTWLIKREPILITGAYIIVFNIGMELLLAEFFRLEVAPWLKFAISIGTLLLCILYARWDYLRVLAPLFRRIGLGIGYLNASLNWVLYLAFFLFKFIVNYLLDQSDRLT